MSQSAQPLNPWLLSYIEQHHSKQSRYQIDKYLIEAGYDAAEIELAWQSITTAFVLNVNSQSWYFSRSGFLVLLLVLIIGFLPIIAPKSAIAVLMWPPFVILPTFLVVKNSNKFPSNLIFLGTVILLIVWIFVVTYLINFFA